MKMLSNRQPQTEVNRSALRRSFKRLLRSGLGALGLGAVAAFSSPGCTRQQYRCKTDTEAYYLLDEKVRQSCEDVSAPYRIEVDSRSRMFNPFDPDRPPMPEDDPQANQFMQRVDGKKGYALWEGNGRTNIVENPQWWTYLPLDERGVLVLDLNEAVRIALLHSTAYQSAREEIYLSALDVSSERFRLDSQFFAGWQSSITADGPRRNGGTDSSTLFSTGPASRGRRPFSMQKQFATGADLVVGFANSLTWQLAGPNDQSATTLLDFALLQPLLRQGGRDVVLERLTLAERTLLANVRAFERYRRAFYVDITTGRGSGGVGPRRRGGVFGGAGFEGFSALGGVFSGGGGGFGGGGATPGAGGFLGLLQSQLEIENQKENILQLEDIYLQFRDNYRELQLTMPDNLTALPQQQLQVSQQLQTLYNAQTQLLAAQASYEQSLDSFKSDLGLPPYLCIEIQDPLLEPFKLISQELRDRRIEVQDFRKALGEANSRILELSTTDEADAGGQTARAIETSDELSDKLATMTQRLLPVADLLNQIAGPDIEQIRKDLIKLEENIPLRRRQLTRLMEVADSERDMVCALLPFGDFNTSFLEGQGLEELPELLREELDALEQRILDKQTQFGGIVEEISTIAGSLGDFPSARDRFRAISERVILGSQDFVAEVNDIVLALQIVQARARTETVTLPEVELTPRDAVEIARVNRRDWLNNRAALVNTWRSIEVVADDLESFLDLSLTGSVQNIDDNPLSIRGSTGRLRAGLTWDAPITRLQERNNYRQVLIQYEQARRSYYAFEDGVWNGFRGALRTVRQNQLRFEIQRFAVQNAAVQNSINADIRQINETLGVPSGPTAAQDSARGLQAFLDTQGTLIGTFVNFEALRRSIDLDLGTMQIDAEGLWIDPGPLRVDTVGGSLGEAIMDYGLTDGEVLLRDQIEIMDVQPVEVAPSDQLPGEASSRNKVGTPVGGPVEPPSIAALRNPPAQTSIYRNAAYQVASASPQLNPTQSASTASYLPNQVPTTKPKPGFMQPARGQTPITGPILKR
ncbi:MAG: hypothetical protein Aurels2KO_38480 [Aureliella sp.]